MSRYTNEHLRMIQVTIAQNEERHTGKAAWDVQPPICYMNVISCASSWFAVGKAVLGR